MAERREERNAGGGDGDTDHTDPSFNDHSPSVSKKYIHASNRKYLCSDYAHMRRAKASRISLSSEFGVLVAEWVLAQLKTLNLG